MTERERLIELLDEITIKFRFTAWENTDKIADHLLANGVIVLPCKVGSTIYRIDTMDRSCSYENEHYHEFYCRNCRHLLNGDCDARKEPYIYVIKDANAQTILGNQHLLGTRAFLTKEEAEKALKERSKWK
jgi:hypothetical protein